MVDLYCGTDFIVGPRPVKEGVLLKILVKGWIERSLLCEFVYIVAFCRVIETSFKNLLHEAQARSYLLGLKSPPARAQTDIVSNSIVELNQSMSWHLLHKKRASAE